MRLHSIVLALSSFASACSSLPSAALDSAAHVVELSGSVVLVDDGRRAPDSGHFALLFVGQHGTNSIDVAVDHGHWAIRVPGSFVELAIGRMQLENRGAHCELELSSVPATHKLELEARWTKRNLVRIASKSSGVEFTRGIEVVASENPVHPDPSDARIGRDLGSPIELPEFLARGSVPERWRAQRSWWLRAAGYAWTRIDVDHSAGEARRVELETGGDLLVSLTASEPKLALNVRLARGAESARVASALTTSDTPLVLESLAPGDYRIAVERESGDAVVELASRDALVVAGKATELNFELSNIAPSANSMPLFGTVRIPRAWNSSELRFALERFDAQRSDYSPIAPPATTFVGGEVWTWNAGVLDAGRCLAFIQPFQSTFVFDYDPAKASNFALVVPPPAEVRVKLVGNRRHLPITDETVHWYGMPPPDWRGMRTAPIPFDETRGAYCFTAPVGDIVVYLLDDRDGAQLRPEHIVAGANEFELTVTDYVRVRIFTTENGRRVPWPEDADLRMVEDDGESHRRGLFQHHDCMEAAVDVAGHYSFELYDMFDSSPYEPASVEVDALDDRIVEVEIPLKRLH